MIDIESVEMEANSKKSTQRYGGFEGPLVHSYFLAALPVTPPLTSHAQLSREVKRVGVLCRVERLAPHVTLSLLYFS